MRGTKNLNSLEYYWKLWSKTDVSDSVSKLSWNLIWSVQERFLLFCIRHSAYLVCVVKPPFLSAPAILIHCRCIGYSVTESSVSFGCGSRDEAPPHISAPTGRCQRRWWRHASRAPPARSRDHGGHDELPPMPPQRRQFWGLTLGEGPWALRGRANVWERGSLGREGGEGGSREGRAIKEVVKPRVAVNLPTPLSCPTRTVMAI